MDAAAELAFDRLAHAAGRRLWPGTVRLAGVDYAASVVRERVAMQLSSLAGQVDVDAIRVEISKSELAEAPAMETAVLYEGEIFTVKETAGHGPTDSAWSFLATKDPRQ